MAAQLGPADASSTGVPSGFGEDAGRRAAVACTATFIKGQVDGALAAQGLAAGLGAQVGQAETASEFQQTLQEQETLMMEAEDRSVEIRAVTELEDEGDAWGVWKRPTRWSRRRAPTA